MDALSLDRAGIRAYALYFAFYFVPALILARIAGYALGLSGTGHLTLYAMVFILTGHRLLRRFFSGEGRLATVHERHRLALACATVTSTSGALLTLLAAQAGLIVFLSTNGPPPSPALALLVGLPVFWATDYVLFRIVLSDLVCQPLFERSRLR